jgi:hypothetical protein
MKFIAVLLILGLAVLGAAPAFAAEKDSCVHVCAAVCTSAQTAAIAKFDCRRKPHHVCYDDYGTCARAPNGRCAWQKDDKLVDCVSDKIGQSAADVMK